jgi:DNA-binding transcriptional regulator GbsR (MarR family)
MFLTMNGEGLAAVRARIVDALGRQSAFWGVGRLAGQLYAVLYLSAEPLALSDLATVLGVTKASVSTAVRGLERLGMVRRVLPPGDRRVFFEAVPDFWLIVRRVLERRQKPEFDESFRLVREALAAARATPPGGGRDFVVRRLEALQAFHDELDRAVAAVLRLDPRRLPPLLQMLSGGGEER